jgi:opacity protein-like surface antigen
MKNIVLSAVAVLAMSSFAVAGGDIAPVEEPVVVAEPVITDSGFYLGLAYSFLNASTVDYYDVQGQTLSGTLQDTILDESYSDIMIQAGYKFNSYVAIEGRYWFGLNESVDVLGVPAGVNVDNSVDAWGIYVKPMYPVTDAFDIYALLGYGAAEYDLQASNSTQVLNLNTDSVDGFSWGLGASYAFTDNIAVFVDYVSIYNDSEDFVTNNGSTGYTDNEIDTWNFGVTYQF